MKFSGSKMGSGLGSNDSISTSIIEEEKEKHPGKINKQICEGLDQQQIPFPDSRLFGVG